MSLTTPLTRLLGIRTPVISAPMAFAAGGLLASEVSLAGGFGFMAPVPGQDISHWKEQLSIAKNAFSKMDGLLPIGAGFLGWILDAQSPAPDPASPHKLMNEFLQAALDAHVRAIWFSFGNDLKRWIDVVREHDRAVGNNDEKNNRTLIFVQVGSVEQARVAVEQWRVDVLAVQGIEAGGHGFSTAPPLLTLLVSVISALTHDQLILVPLLATGGLTTSSQIAACLTLGAAGAVVGTRFLATPESIYPPAYKDAILAAGRGDQIGSATERSFNFDWLQGRTTWPEGIDGRALTIPAIRELKELGGVGSLEDLRVLAPGSEDEQKFEHLRRKFQEAEKRGEKDASIVWAGSGVGLVNDIKPAKDIVEEFHRGIEAHLRFTGSSIVGA